jgi:protein-disulfide isomerase
MNDVLYQTDLQKDAINVREVAERAGVDYDALTRGMTDIHSVNRLIGVIRYGQKLGVNGTPAFLIDRKLYLGQIPADVIENALR